MVMAKCSKIKKPLEILEKGDLQRIHQTSMKILEEIGVKMDDPRALKTFKENGCEVDEKKHVVKLREEFVKEHLKKVPKVFTVYSRGGEKMEVGSGGFYTLSPSDNVYLLDMETGNRRTGTLEDCKNMARLIDALEFYHICCTPLLPQEIDPQIRGLYAAAETLRNMEKHYLPEPVGPKEAHYILEMAEAIVGGEEELRKKPITSTVICPTSPLQFPENSLITLWEFVQRKLPLDISSAPLVGVGSPVTMAGSLALSNAENLSGLTLIQLITGGSPALYGGSCLPFDMAAANLLHGAIEFGIFALAEAQLARFYGVPSYGAGGGTNAKLCDAQAGYEKMATTLLSYLAGNDWAVECSLDNHSLFAPEDIVLQNELSGLVVRFGSYFRVDDDMLAFDVIKKVGIGGNFLAEKHTRMHVRTDLWYPPVADRATYDVWLSKGGKELKIRAKEYAKKILAEHKPSPLDRDVNKKIDAILKQARKELKA